ncbi:hypothetical protein D3C86_1644690 [compost metagenome]
MDRAQRPYSTADLALAYELSQEGIQWKRIAQGLGGSAAELMDAVKNAKRDGLKGFDARSPIPKDILHCSSECKRTSRLSWSSIAEYFGQDARQLRKAVFDYRYRLKHAI